MERSKLSSAETIHVIGGPRLHIPEKWTAESFVQHGAAMIRALARTAKFTQFKAIPVVAKLMNQIFANQLKAIIRRVEQSRQHFRLGFRSADVFTFALPQEEQLWKEAIEYVLGSGADVQVVTQMTPPIQSVMAQGYSKTAYLLGQQADAQAAAAITKQTREIASKIVGVNDTTKNNILNAVKDGVKQGMTVKELSAHVEERAGTIFGNRSLTIARTELNKAWTEGSAISFKESGAITLLSVIGCEAREAQSPHYKGESTCNYPDLPIDALDAFLAVGFHPNHTGTLVPSGFKSDDETEE